MKYLFLLYGPDGPLPEPGTEEAVAMYKRWSAATGAMAQAGVLIDCAATLPTATEGRDAADGHGRIDRDPPGHWR